MVECPSAALNRLENDMIDVIKIGKRIASLRKERGYTGEQLAERLQVSPQAVSKWENAKCLPETAILPALAEALHCAGRQGGERRLGWFCGRPF